MNKFKKRAFEAFRIKADFAQNMEATETVSTCTVTSFDRYGVDTSTTALKQDSKELESKACTIIVQDGLVSKSPYKILFNAVTSLGHKWELEVSMEIIS